LSLKNKKRSTGMIIINEINWNRIYSKLNKKLAAINPL